MGVLDGIRLRIRQFSIWKVPNFLLEPRGLFLGERIDLIERLGKIRSLAGVAILTGAVVYYSGLRHLAVSAGKQHGLRTFDVTNNTPEGNWILGVIVSIVVAILVLPLVSVFLVWRAKPGARKATLSQLRWPFIAIAAWFGIFAAASPFMALGDYAVNASKHMSLGPKAVAYLFSFLVAIVLLVWTVKAIYFAATGMFRAEDGHPLLGVIAAPIVAAIAAAMMLTVAGGNGLVGVPSLIGDALVWGGTVTIFITSWVISRILKQRFPLDYPFRTGPIGRISVGTDDLSASETSS